MKITTVITTYNRRHCVASAVRSAFAALPNGEVVVVDDASTDGTPAFIESTFQENLSEGRLRMIVLKKNGGVTAAKNAGYDIAAGDWVIFLDSDDAMLAGAGPQMEQVLATAGKCPVVFFRCRDQDGRFVGQREGETLLLDLKTYLDKMSFGEALTAFNKRIAGLPAPYPSELRGYEALGCLRLIRRFGPALLSSIVARTYETTSTDRLSVSAGFINRMPLLARGHRLVVREFGSEMGLRSRIALSAKSAAYSLLWHTRGIWKWSV